MGPLIKVSSTSFQAFRFRQDARLVANDSVDIERQKVIARHRAFCTRLTGSSKSADLKYINEINRSFASAQTVSLPASKESAGASDTLSAPQLKVTTQPAPKTFRAPSASSVSAGSASAPDYVSSADPAAAHVPEAQSGYTMQRASFEWRVAGGDISFIPSLDMTIITQYPDVHFEYTGDFNYVPPRKDTLNYNINQSI